ncbi:Fructosamine kinase-domain-containing protein [Aspergillus taichungensis]|uniref:protein-ribulosamine 3-kinase n=1 Tax=Aspergillus taichungensis TaxID=482145 RepID=A0A2J5HYH8_9EURO|nr:Fructosamine kinase-domain-containing protein [Aspergillus taichungensis]
MNTNGSPTPGENNVVDPSVVAALPKESRVLRVTRHGTSFWNYTGRIEVERADSQVESFFIKVISNSHGHNMVQGEYESMKAIHAVCPEFAPKPIAWGTYTDTPETYFFLAEYRDMSGDMPQPEAMGSYLASLHQGSASPNGKFGFHITTYTGNLPQNNDWEKSWEVFFAKNMRQALDCEIQAKGFDSEFEALVPVLFDVVIPRLLRPLETDGRTVKPCLVHGDLWYGNSGIDTRTKSPLIFDACSFYAHNEYEFGQWRPVCNRFGPEYLKAYHAHCTVSEPVEDYDGRLDLYKLRFNTQVSALFPENQGLRQQMLGDMRDLIRRYG